MEFNPQKQLAGLLEWMDQQMTQCGGKTAVIGISGGKDSSTVAALAVAAYGRENVYGVLLPNGVQPDIDYSQALVEHLQIPHCTINIHDAVQGVLPGDGEGGPDPQPPDRRESALPRPHGHPVCRGPDAARRHCHQHQQPLRGLGGLLHHLRRLRRSLLPAGHVHHRGGHRPGPCAGPAGKVPGEGPLRRPHRLTDEDNLGFTYHAVNEYVRRGVCDPAIREQIDRKHRTSRFKFQTLPVYHNGLPMALTDETDYYK